ncbi:MAG: hypothetical protein HOQ05_12370 [Corynebacteriales bacterium]|nr:hypothetical protein [Mycobacteriales bacterium]
MPVSLEQFERDVRGFLANVRVLAEVIGQAGEQLAIVPPKFGYLRPAASGLQRQLTDDAADIEQQLTPGPQAEASLGAPRPGENPAAYAQELQQFIARLPELVESGIELSRTLVASAHEDNQLPYVRRRIAVLASDIVDNGSHLYTTSYDLGVAGGVRLEADGLTDQFAALAEWVDRAQKENHKVPIDIRARLVQAGVALTEMETAANYAIRFGGENPQGWKGIRTLREASEELRSLEPIAAVPAPLPADWDPAIDAINFHRLHADMSPEAISGILDILRSLRERATDHNAFHDSQPHKFAEIRRSVERIAPEIRGLAETFAALGAAAAQAPEVRELTRQLGSGPDTDTFTLTEDQYAALNAAYTPFGSDQTATVTQHSAATALNPLTPGGPTPTLPVQPGQGKRKPGPA